MPPDREFDLILWGATGAVGRRAAHHLALRAENSALRWAIGGRNKAKLDAVRHGLAGAGPGVPILVGDSHDVHFMQQVAARARVVCTTVGPFALYGTALLAACANAGTHYCDLTGESLWMRDMIAAHQDDAVRTGARIVHACGHDSVPSDLGVLFLQTAAMARHAKPCPSVRTRITRMKGGFSGGTAASFLNAMERRHDTPEMGRVMRDPYALNPEGERTGPDGPDRMMPLSVTYDADLGAWTKPYFMAPMNAKVVRRSNALLGYPYGRDFRYEETAASSVGLSGWLDAVGYTLKARGFLTAMAIPFTRRLLKKHVLPKSGEGPDAALREVGYYEIVLIGTFDDGTVMQAQVTGQGDPGVESTSRMLVESALCLAEDGDRIAVSGGFWTPASAMGQLLIARLAAHAGLRFELLG